MLNPARTESRWNDTQLSIARKIKERDGEIQHLVVWLGANNCLATVVRLTVKPEAERPPGPCSTFVLWSPAAFDEEYRRLAREVAALAARNVYVATIPHVTIPPVSRGIMQDRGQPLPPGDKYFDYYAYFFVRDQEFDPDRHRHLTKADARKIDGYIDAYNATIVSEAQRHGWHVVDTCKLLDDLAFRRNHGHPKYPLPPALANLDVRLLRISPDGRLTSGGLISLDGVHPTYCGYAVIAQEFINVIRPQQPDIRDVDFAAVRRQDALVSRPPRTLDDLLAAAETLDQHFRLSSWLNPSLP